MSKKDKSLKATFAAALENYKKKNYKNTEICCYKILSIDPNHFDSISMLATITAINKNFDKAIATKGPDNSLLAMDGWHIYVEINISFLLNPGNINSP